MLDELLGRPRWQADGACLEHPTVNIFPERGEPLDDAREVCRSCLVRVECLDYALALGDELVGVWGGTSARERRARRATPEPAASSPLRARRLAAGLTQAELAAALGVTQEAVSGWERGKSSPRPELLEALERRFSQVPAA
jgi:DNA-binding transcriptional regulator YiaG